MFCDEFYCLEQYQMMKSGEAEDMLLKLLAYISYCFVLVMKKIIMFDFTVQRWLHNNAYTFDYSITKHFMAMT